MQNSSQTQSKELSRVPEAKEESGTKIWLNPRILFFLLLAYFGLQILVRVTMSTSVDLDESEQVVCCQRFRLGYGSAPPLYTWLQMAFFQVFGESVLGLSVLKNLLLLTIYGLTYATARLITRSTWVPIVATLSLLYLPQVAWESQRDLTHSTLASCFSLGTLYCFLRLHEQPRTRWYVLFGLCAGAGLITKFNYALWLVGISLAAITIRELRPTIIDRRMLLALALCLTVFLPNALWMLEHKDLALITSSKFQIDQSGGWFRVTALGLKNLVTAVFYFCIPLASIYFLLFCKAPAHTDAAERPTYIRMLLRSWLIIGIILLGVVLVGRATGFKDRWFTPILIALPIAAAAIVKDRLTRGRFGFMAGLSLTIMLAVLIIMPGRLLAAERLHREEPLTRPYAQLAAQLVPLMPAGALVICDTRLLAGNLRLGLRDALVIPPELTDLMRTDQKHCFLVWDARRGQEVPWELRAWKNRYRLRNTRVSEPRFFEATYRYHKSKQYRLGMVQLFDAGLTSPPMGSDKLIAENQWKPIAP